MEKLLIISAFSILFTLIGTKFLKNFLENKKIFDIPNERSSHSKPIPTGGGWIINLCIIGIIFFLDPYDKIPAIITILGLAFVSWKNDIKNLKKIRGFMYINGKNVGSGMGVDIMGDPILALEWIVGRKDVIGDFLPAGSVVLLGSLVQTKWLNKGDEVKIFIDEIGESRAIFF